MWHLSVNQNSSLLQLFTLLGLNSLDAIYAHSLICLSLVVVKLSFIKALVKGSALLGDSFVLNRFHLNCVNYSFKGVRLGPLLCLCEKSFLYFAFFGMLTQFVRVVGKIVDLFTYKTAGCNRTLFITVLRFCLTLLLQRRFR
jgi:hypothetical protein